MHVIVHTLIVFSLKKLTCCFVFCFAISYKKNSDVEQFCNFKTCFWTVPHRAKYCVISFNKSANADTKYAYQMCGKVNGNEDLMKTV